MLNAIPVLVALASGMADLPWDASVTQHLALPYATTFLSATALSSALAPSGDIYLAGNPLDSSSVPAKSFGDTSRQSVLVVKTDSTGATQYAIRIGGALNATVVMDGETPYLTGDASPTGLYTTAGAYQSTAPDTQNWTTRYLCRLQPADGTPTFCTYLDDGANLLLATGTTGTALLVVSASGGPARVAKLDPTGSRLLYSTSIDIPGVHAAMDADGSVFVGGQGLFVKLDPNGTLTMLRDISVQALTVDATGPVTAEESANSTVIRQYAQDGSTLVFERDLGVKVTPNLAVVGENIVVGGITDGIWLPLKSNVRSCERIRTATYSNPESSFLFRLGMDGAIVQSTWVTTGFGALTPLHDGTAAMAQASQSGLDVVTVGPSSKATLTRVGCFSDITVGTYTVAAPGLLVNINGESLTASDTVTFDGIAAPLLSRTERYLQAVVPFALAKNGATRLCLGSDCADIVAAPLQPLIFTTTANHAAAVNADGSINSADHPAKAGSVVALFATGLGPLSPAVADGQLVSTDGYAVTSTVAIGFLAPPGSPFSVPGPTTFADVVYAGAAPGCVAGVYQINFRVPQGLPGTQQIRIEATNPDGYFGRSATLRFDVAMQ